MGRVGKDCRRYLENVRGERGDATNKDLYAERKEDGKGRCLHDPRKQRKEGR